MKRRTPQKMFTRPLPKECTAMATEHRLLTREEAAAFLGLKAQTLAVWASTKRYGLRYIKAGRCVRYRQADLDRFVESRTVGAGV